MNSWQKGISLVAVSGHRLEQRTDPTFIDILYRQWITSLCVPEC